MIDELAQFINVLSGNMAIVGPRPLPETDYEKLNQFEKTAYRMLPGITDLSSVIFSDEGEILKGSHDPDSKYDITIRP